MAQAICDGAEKRLPFALWKGRLYWQSPITCILFFGKSLLAIFNNDAEVISIGYIRLMLIMIAHSFSLLYEVMSGYLRGFGISLVPAILTMAGVCGIRICWIQWVFPLNRTFQTIMTVYPISLAATALLMFFAVAVLPPVAAICKSAETGIGMRFEKYILEKQD